MKNEEIGRYKFKVMLLMVQLHSYLLVQGCVSSQKNNLFCSNIAFEVSGSCIDKGRDVFYNDTSYFIFCGYTTS